MEKKKVSQSVLFLGWMVLMVLLKVFLRKWQFGLPMLWWGVGAISGYIFVFLDGWVYEVVNNTKNAWNWKLSDLLKLIADLEEKESLVMRSALFVAVWLVLGILTVTSVGNQFSRGLVWGIGTHLVLDLFIDYSKKRMAFDWWFRQIKRQLSVGEKKGFLIVVGLLYLLLAVNL